MNSYNIIKRICLIFSIIFVLLSFCSCSYDGDISLNNSGRKIVPNVIGLSLKEAADILTSEGFNNISTDRNYENFDLSRVYVSEQSIQAETKADSNDEILLTCKFMYKISLEIKSDYNLLFNKYDVDILIDDRAIGSVSNGESFEKSVDILEGSHQINIYKSGKNKNGASQDLDITSDTLFKCTVMHDGSVSFKDIEITKLDNVVMIEEPNDDVSSVISTLTDVPKLKKTASITKDLVVLRLEEDKDNPSRYFISFGEVNDRGAIYNSYRFTESVEPKDIFKNLGSNNRFPFWFKKEATVHVVADVYYSEIIECTVSKVAANPTTYQTTATNTEKTATNTSKKTETNATPAVSVTSKNSSFEIYFLDVGQGDAAVILCDGHAMMIDGGESSKSDFIYSFLKSHNITHLDYIIASHPDADHVGGLSGALNYATIDKALCTVNSYNTKTFNSFVKYLGNQGVTITVPSLGDKYTLGSAEFTIVGPVTISKGEKGDSLVIRIKYGNTSFLFTGDAEENEESDILNSGYNIESTVLKVAHHGSNKSTKYLFLKTVYPKYAVISVGGSNSYGHPTDDVLSRLHDADAITYRTDMNGTIHCTSDGNKVVFDVEKNKDMDTYSYAGGFVKKATTAVVGSSVAGSNNTPIKEKTEDGETVTYVINTNTKKYHYPDCQYAESIKEKNRWYFTGTKDEIPDIYSPCGHCKP